jgi:hypothetical protein
MTLGPNSRTIVLSFAERGLVVTLAGLAAVLVLVRRAC